MTKKEKEIFCLWAASLISPPDEHLLKTLKKGKIWSFLKRAIAHWGGQPQLFATSFSGHFPDDFLSALRAEYNRLFTDIQGEKISLVESTYKSWTKDCSSNLMWADKKGLLMSDYAGHLREIFDQLSLRIPPEFQSTPDHLILELELLSFLYRLARPEQIRNFIADHLDWIPALKKQIDRAGAIFFYRQTIELINSFLLYEMKNEVN